MPDRNAASYEDNHEDNHEDNREDSHDDKPQLMVFEGRLQLMVYGVSVKELCDDIVCSLAGHNDDMGQAHVWIAEAVALFENGDASGAKVLAGLAHAYIVRARAWIEADTGVLLGLARQIAESAAEHNPPAAESGRATCGAPS